MNGGGTDTFVINCRVLLIYAAATHTAQVNGYANSSRGPGCSRLAGPHCYVTSRCTPAPACAPASPSPPPHPQLLPLCGLFIAMPTHNQTQYSSIIKSQSALKGHSLSLFLASQPPASQLWLPSVCRGERGWIIMVTAPLPPELQSQL